MRIRSKVVRSAAAALIGGALLSAFAHAAGRKSNGTVVVVDDLLGGAAASVKATGGGMTLDGALTPTGNILTSALTPPTTGEAGYFSMLVSSPASAQFQQVFLTSVSLSWTDATLPNPSGSLYQVALSTAADFSGVLRTTGTFGLVVVSTGLNANTSYYAEIKVEYMEGHDTALLSLGSTSTLASPPGVLPFASATASQIVSTWTAGSPANPTGTLYELQTSTAANFTGVVTSSLTYNVSVSSSGLNANTTYYFQVRALNHNSVPTVFVSLASTSTLSNTPAAAGVTFTAVYASSMSVAWSANGNPVNVTTYTVVLSTGASYPNSFAGNVPLSTTPAGSAPAATLTDLAANTTYFLFANAVNHNGVATAFAALGSTTTLANAPATAVTTFTAVNTNSMSVAWGANGNPVNVTTYTVVLSTGSGYPNSYSGNVPLSTAPAGSAPAATLTSLVGNTTYFLFVNAVNHNGVPTPYTALGATATLANVPATVVTTFTAVHVSSVSVAWSNNGNAVDVTKYSVVMSTGSSYPNTYAGNVVLSTTPVGASPAATLTGLTAHKTWFLFVAALNHNGASTAYAVLGSTIPRQFNKMTLAATGGDSYGIAWGDYDNDGDLDLAVANGGVGDEYVARNDGGGVFAKIALTGTGGNSIGIAWGDYDNDGDLDLAVANDAEDEYVARNDSGVFFKITLTGTGGASRGIAWGDYDNDGDLDLAVANTGAQDEYVVRNDGGGVFSTMTLAGTGGDSQAIAWGDYDNDGDLDLAVANRGVEDEYVARNDGGVFTKIPLTGTGGDSLGIAWGDYDGDGDLDLAVANGLGQDEYVARNDGGVFTKITLTGTGGFSAGIAWGDYDSDGDLDLAVANTSGGQDEYIARNDGGGVFSTMTLTGTGGESMGTVWGDYDNDGDLDLAVSNANLSEDEFLLRNDSGTINAAPAPPAGLALSLAYDASASTVTVKWDAGAYDAGGSSATVHYALVVATAPMTLSGDLKRVISPSSFTVTWGNGSPLLGHYLRPAYKVWPGDAASKHGVAFRLDAPNVLAGNFKSDATYYFRLQSIDLGLARSTWSVESSSFIYKNLPPQGRTIAQVLTSSIAVSYTGVSASSYFVEASSTNFGALSPGGVVYSSVTVSSTVVSLAPQGLASNTTYYLRMGGLWQKTTSYALTSPDSAATLANIPATAVTTFTAVHVSSVSVAWSANGNPVNVTTYTVVLSTGVSYPNSHSGNRTISTAPAGSLSAATLTSLVGNTTYFLFVNAVNHNGVATVFAALGSTATLAAQPASAVSTFSAVANNALTGAWDGNGNAAGTLYEVVVSTRQTFQDADLVNVLVSTRPSGAPSADFSGLGANTTYYLFARAVGHAGLPTAYTALGATVTLVNLPTTAVTTFTAVTSAGLTAAWSANGNGPGTQYSAVVSTSAPYPNSSAGNFVISTAPSGAPSADFTGLFANATYYFSVAAINRAGSPTAYAALGSTVTLLNAPVSAVSTFTTVNASSMSVAWGANNNIAGTRYEAALSTGTPYPNSNNGNVVISTEPLGSPAAVINNLVGNTTYYLAVRAIGRNGLPSAYVALGSSVTLAFAPATAATTFTAVSAGAMSVAWAINGNAVDATTYTVVLTTGSFYPNSFFGNVPLSTAPIGALPTATLSGLSVNTTYFLFIKAVNHNGLSTAYTALGSTATLANIPATVVTTFTTVYTSSMSVAWSANGNPVDVTSYTVVLTTGAAYPNVFAGNQTLSTAPIGALPAATVSGLLSNATYQLFVAAVNHNGVISAYAALGTTVTLVNVPVAAAPTFSAVAANSFVGAWGGNGAGTLYEAVVSTRQTFQDADLVNVSVSTRPEGAASAVFAGLGVNTTYYLFARAVSHAGAPTAYAALGATVTLAAVPVSDASTFTAVGLSSVTAQWLGGGNPPGTQFQLVASTWSGFSGTLRTSGWSAAVSTAVYGLSANATFYFAARARNWSGAPSAYLSLGSTVTLANAPTALAFDGVGSFSLPLAWGPAGNFSGGPASWLASSSLPSAVQGHALASSGGRLYASGGSAGAGALAAVRFAAVAVDGTVGPWTSATPLPAARDSHAMAAWGGRLYVAGGSDGGSVHSTVWWAAILEGGSLGPWRSAPPLPGARHKFTLTAYAGALFAVGGDNGFFPQSTVYAAAIRPDGSLGPWSTTTALPAARAGHGAAIALGRLYVSGGVGAGLESSVLSAPIGGATVGAWDATAPALPAGRTRHAMTASPSRLYVAGGHDGVTAQTDVWSAALADNGDVGAWESQASLPSARYLHGLALFGERLAAVGGSDGSAALDSVNIATLTGTEYLAESAGDLAYSINYSSWGWRRGTSFEFSGLIPNTTYYARVRGRSLAGMPTIVIALGSTITLAAVPQSVPSTFTVVEISSIGVQWAAGSNPAGTEFRARTSTAADFSGVTVLGSWGTATSALFNSLALNTSYYFEASGRNAAGVEGSPLAMGAAYTRATAPSGSVITSAQTTGFSLEWSANGNPAGSATGPGTRFEAQAAILADFSTVLASSMTFSTAAAFSGLPSASTFYARVRAFNGNGLATSFDNAVSTRTGVDVVAPGISTGAFAYQSAAAGALYAAWTAPGDDGYVGDLAAGSTFYVQWTTLDPAAVLWSTASAQIVSSTGPVKLGASVTLLISGLPSQQVASLRVWTSDDGGNYSAPSATFSAYVSPFSLTRVDGTSDAGRSPSLAVDRFGNLHAAYRTAGGELRYVKRTLGVWGASQAIDAGPVAELAVAVDNDGNPQILYRDAGVARLKIARFSGTWAVSIIENGSFRAGGLALDPDGRAYISYYDAVLGDMKFGRWMGSTWSTETVRSAGDVGRVSGLALDAAQNPHIAYSDDSAPALRFSSKTAASWSDVVVAAAYTASSSPAVAVDANGSAFIAYASAGTGAVNIASITASGLTILSTVEAGPGFDTVGGAALDGAGRLAVVYRDSVRLDLKFARWTGTAFSTGTIDSYGDQAEGSALAIDGSGGVQLAYYDKSGGALKAASYPAAVAAAAGGGAGSRAQAPYNFTGAAVSVSSIQWTWTDNAANELGYRLYGAAVSTGPYALIAGTATIAALSGSGGMGSYTEGFLTVGTTYYRFVVAVNAGGGAASKIANAYPFNTADTTPPAITNNQAGDSRWRRTNDGLYNVDFLDVGGSKLDVFAVKASTVPGGAGPDLVAFTDVAAAINADTYLVDWPLPAAVFNGLREDVTNYISVRAADGAGNVTISTDTFFVKKDTTPPSLVDNQAGDAAWRRTPGTLYNADALDATSGLEAFQYSASLTVGAANAALVAWTDIALPAGATSYTTDWPIAFTGLASNATNYISLRTWDRAGSTVTAVDAFYVLKDTVPPTTAITVPASTFRSSLAAISGTAGDLSGVQGTELSIQQVSGSLYWDGGVFGSAAQFFFTAGSGTAWSLSPGIAWVNNFAYRIVARSSDNAGNYSVSYATADFTLDASSPTAAVTVPATGGTISALPTISGTAADVAPVDSGLSTVEVRLRRNSDGQWWNWFTSVWSPTAISTIATGTSGWSVAPAPLLRAGLDNGTSYFITVRASDNALPANSGDFFVSGSTFTWVDVTAPAAVGNLAAFSGSQPGRINLTWTAAGDDDGLGLILSGQYRIFYATYPAAVASTATAQVIVSTALVNPGNAQSFTLTGLGPGTTYYLRLALADSDFNWSNFSNQASTVAAPAPYNAITGHVVNLSSQGITAVQVDCWDIGGTLWGTTFTVADGSGTYVMSGLTPGNYQLRATWTANGISSSLWQDTIAMGSFDVDFVLEINYALATLTGTLGALTASSAGGGGGLSVANSATASFAGSHIELYQQGRQVSRVQAQPNGRWTIAGLLPGKYSVRAFTGLGYTAFQEVELSEGEVKVLGFVFNPLPAASVFAFPNPARNATTIRFITAIAPLEANILIFDLAGNMVREIPGSQIVAQAQPGLYHAAWDLNNNSGSAVASGVYLVTVKVKGGIDNQKATVVKKVAVVR